MNSFNCGICFMKLIENGEWDNDPNHCNALNTMYCCGYVFHRRCLEAMEKEAEKDLQNG